MKTLLIHARTFARLGPRLKGAGAALRILTIDDAGAAHDALTNERLGELPPIDLVFGNTDAFFSPGMQAFLVAILKTPALDWFQSSAAGVEHPALVMIGQKARVYTANHTQCEAIAEWALWQAFDFLRDGPGHRAQQAAAEWQRRMSREFAGTRWLIVGYGAIGEATGRRVSALGGTVTGVRRRPGPAEGAARIAGPEALSGELGRADIVLLCVPHTRETETLANAAFFAAMAPDALFMNAGRGALVDEAALIAGLEAGKPAFAALDVTQAEPLPAANALWGHPKVALTPHDSAHTAGSAARADETFLTNLDLYLKGQKLINVVPASAFTGMAL
jgi:phosphoglycerate dehydrogenase-like enzyme